MKNRPFTYLRDSLTIVVGKISDLLLPKESRVTLLENLGPDGLFTKIPQAENFDLPTQAGFDTSKIKAIFNYRTALCRQAIWEIKYRANKKLIRDFSLLLYEYILEELNDLETFSNFKNIILIPIPCSKNREREKGFNQCVLIADELIKIDKERNSNNFTVLENFLIKKNDTIHQARVSNRKMRLKNVIDTFSINMGALPGPDVQNSFLRLTRTNHCKSFLNIWPTDYSFLIIDDVITTGATMREAFRALGSAGIPPRKIRGFALAH